MHGWLPKPTCKKVTRKDAIWILPELQGLLLQVDVQDTWWPDHALLLASFRGGDSVIPRFTWRVPQQVKDVEPAIIPLPARCQNAAVAPRPSEPGLAYLVWQDLEDRWDAHRRQSGQAPLTPQQRGRAETMETRLCKTAVAPPRKGVGRSM